MGHGLAIFFQAIYVKPDGAFHFGLDFIFVGSSCDANGQIWGVGRKACGGFFDTMA